MAKEYDALFKELLTRRPADWLPVCGLGEAQGPVTLIDTDVSAVTGAADKVARVSDPRGDWLFHTEAQAGPDADVPQRLLRYSVLLHTRHDLPVASAVLLLRRQAFLRVINGRYTVELPGRGPVIDFHYGVVRVWELPRAALLGGPIGAAPLAVLTDETATEMLPTWLGMRERVAELSEEEQQLYLTMVDRLAMMRYSAETLRAVYERMPSVGPTVYEEWLAEKLAPKWEAEYRPRHYAEHGKQLLLQLGAKRFGEPGPDIRRAIEGLREPDSVDHLVARVYETNSWDELFRDA